MCFPPTTNDLTPGASIAAIFECLRGRPVVQGPVLGQAVSGQLIAAGSQLFHIAGPPLMTGGKFDIEGGFIAIAITILGTPILLIYRGRSPALPGIRCFTSK